jgi:glycosyltransferase involved in cell wall biosynthesis
MIMKTKVLALLSKSNLPSARLRFIDMVPLLTEYSIKMETKGFAKGLGRALQILSLSKYDLIIIQKKTSLNGIELFLIKKFANKIIYDFDDATMFHELEQARPLTGMHFIKFLNTINIANTVVAGNDFLASFCRSNVANVYKFPTPVDINKYYPLRRANKKIVTLGWIGVPGSMVHLQRLLPALREIAKKFTFELIIISRSNLVCKGLRIKNIEWQLDKENVFLNSIDIGLMPLDDSLWTNGKGGYKLIQYGAVGIPSIGSAVGINKEIIIHKKTGYLANSLEEWREYLELLISSAPLRKKLGHAARSHIVKKYSLKAYARNYARAITNTMMG